jgi:HSP20 family protein
MVETVTKVPVRTDKKGVKPIGAPAQWAPMETLRREIDRLFEGMSGSWPFASGRNPLDFVGWPREAQWRLTPAVDVAESDKDFEITAELPGMNENDVELTLANGNLVIKGEKKEERESRETDYYLSERRYGSFVRAFELPASVDAAKIEASFAKGVLRVKLPKSAEAQKNETKIPVKAA